MLLKASELTPEAMTHKHILPQVVHADENPSLQRVSESASQRVGESASRRVGESAFVLEEGHPPALLGAGGIVPDSHRGQRVAAIGDTGDRVAFNARLGRDARTPQGLRLVALHQQSFWLHKAASAASNVSCQSGQMIATNRILFFFLLEYIPKFHPL